MFSKSKINEPGPRQGPEAPERLTIEAPVAAPSDEFASPDESAPAEPVSEALKAKPPASILSSDLVIEGNMKTSGDIQIEGEVEGDIRAHLLTVGESATVKGEVVADEVVVNGRVVGRVRGLKVRLTSTARVEGDIIHKTIAIESGAHFEGSVARRDDPLTDSAGRGNQAANGPDFTRARVTNLSHD